MTTIQLVLGAVVSLIVTFGAAFIGSRFLPGEWYRSLRKPAWNPPNGIFAPVWTVLYLLMAVSAWLVWRRVGFAAVPFCLYAIQLILNAAWSWTFFGQYRIRAALADIVALWLAILATLVSFWGIEPWAGILLIPYLAWVSFAMFLNWTIWRLNRP